MAATARYFVCDRGHEFGITSWGTPPLACPLCRAPYKPVGRGRKPSSPAVEVMAFSLYALALTALTYFQW